MSRQQRRQYERLRRDIPESFEGSHDGSYLDDVLHGRTAASFSNAGEELTQEDVAAANDNLYEGLRESQQERLGQYVDSRTRRNRTQDWVDVFRKQIPCMADAFLKYSLDSGNAGLDYLYELPGDAVVQETREVLVVDMFAATYKHLSLIAGDEYISTACLRQGWMPVSAYYPTVVITVRALEVFRVTNLRCPRLGVQAFTRMLCDIHGVAPRPYLGAQFSVALDLYHAVRADVDSRVQVALGRDAPNWRLKNSCPACLYKVEDEPTLLIPVISVLCRTGQPGRPGPAIPERVFTL
ncbi:hypothetical protein DFH07DRAFT_970647 [Mycena maculata]|uniref:Uncharacterized protein n=1 Tax=Mycena maculata TaxID=230809 RepID=A0AAD7MP66_9AGAR|nr:hypothetical protein DFH07DRAFT_970647 [Mycena maculata]